MKKKLSWNSLISNSWRTLLTRCRGCYCWCHWTGTHTNNKEYIRLLTHTCQIYHTVRGQVRSMIHQVAWGYLKLILSYFWLQVMALLWRHYYSSVTYKQEEIHNRMHLYFQSNGLTSRAKPMHIGRSIPVLSYLLCTHTSFTLTHTINLETPFDLSIHAFGLWEDPWPGFQPPSLTMSSEI